MATRTTTGTPTTGTKTTRTTRLGTTNTAARGINVILGAWLLISAFIWQHAAAQFWNTLIMGIIVAGFALGALRIPQLRFVNTAAAAWLLVSIWALPTMSSATAWNNGLVAVAIFVVSLVGPELAARVRRPAHA